MGNSTIYHFVRANRNIVLDVVGFYFLDLATDYKPADDLAKFLADGPPPVYIGYGQIGLVTHIFV